MDKKQVADLIAQGRYEEALDQAKLLGDHWNLIYQSRVEELTGHFEQALVTAQRSEKTATSDEDHIATAVAKAYACWRLFKFDIGHSVLDTVEPLVSKTVSSNPWSATFYNIRGLLFWKAGQLDSALTDFEYSLNLRRKMNLTSAIGYSLNNLGNTYLKMNDLPHAEQYYTESLRIREKLGHHPALAASQNSFGRLEDQRGNHDQAFEHHHRCLEIWQEVGNTQFIAKAYRFLAINAYYRKSKDRDSYLNQSDQLFTKLENTTDLATNERIKQNW